MCLSVRPLLYALVRRLPVCMCIRRRLLHAMFTMGIPDLITIAGRTSAHLSLRTVLPVQSRVTVIRIVVDSSNALS